MFIPIAVPISYKPMPMPMFMPIPVPSNQMMMMVQMQYDMMMLNYAYNMGRMYQEQVYVAQLVEDNNNIPVAQPAHPQ
jgi:hypothetical protein